jgi:DNA-binding NarL/FixJ family response regulator
VPPRTDLKEAAFLDGKIRCVLVHDHVLLRQGLRRLLEDEPDIQVVSEAGNAAECLRKVYEFQPDVLVADTATFGMPAREADELVAQESARTRIVFLSMQEQAIPPVDEVRDTTTGCAVRETSAAELAQMVRSSSGNPQSQSQQEVSKPQRPVPGTSLFSQGRALTAREREVLKLLAEGKTVRAAATVLGLSSKTVDAHKFNLMRKLGIHNKAELVMWAIQKRVVKLPANF